MARAIAGSNVLKLEGDALEFVQIASSDES